MSGTRLGPYEVVARIGAGGMGEVFRARDTRLNRDVAIKVLPEEFANDAQLQLRLEREARAISQLNHPHICTLYDVGKASDVSYLVMELLEGETLAARIAKGPLPVDDAVRYALEICEALEKAHRAGVVHRDLKPGNIMITPSGAKLLDFGLARLRGTSETNPATEVKPLTAQGVVVGTLQYMAPEQIAGGAIDERTDIFAFGAVLYEMLTGAAAFQATTRTSLVAAIVSGEPPQLTRVRPGIPSHLEAIVKKCLAKDPGQRWQCAGDLKWELTSADDDAVVAASPAHRILPWLIAALAVAGATILGFIAFRPSVPRAPVRFSIMPPAPWTFAMNYNTGPPAVSPDGRFVAFPATDDQGRILLWVRDLGKADAVPLAGTEGAGYPFFSPDSQSVAFFASGSLKRVEVSGGAPPQTLCPAPLGRGGAWSAENGILFAGSGNSPLYRVSGEGGVPQAVTRLDATRREASHRAPAFLPDGKHFLFLIRTPATPGHLGDAIYAASIDDPKPRLVMEGSTNVTYVEPGYLLFIRDRLLFAQRFNRKTLQLEGEAKSVTREPLLYHAAGWGYFAAARRGGVLVFASGPAASTFQFLDRQGNALSPPLVSGEIENPSLTMDGQSLLYTARDPETGGANVWMLDLARKLPRRLTFQPRDNFFGFLTPDGSHLIYASNRGGFPSIFMKSIDSNEEQPLFTLPFAAFSEAISADGRVVAFRIVGGNTQNDLYTVVVGGGKPVPFAASTFSEVDASFSPDGQWIAYASNESGRYEVYAARYPGAQSRVQISTGGGIQPVWRGHEIFYVAQGNRIMVTAVTNNGRSLQPGTATQVASAWLRPSRNEEREFDVTPDGKRLLVNTLPADHRAMPITVVIDWASDL